MRMIMLVGFALAAGLAAPAAAFRVTDLAEQVPAIWAGVSSGNANAQVLAAEVAEPMPGEVFTFVPFMTNTGPMTLEVAGHRGPVEIFTAAGLRQLRGGEITAGRLVAVAFDDSVWALLEDARRPVRK